MQSLLRVQLLMGILILDAWRNKGEILELDADRAKHLAELNPPRVKILGPGESPSLLEELVTSDTGLSGTGEQTKPADDSLESAGFAGKTLNLLQLAGIHTLSQLREKLASGEKIKGVGDATLASIQAQLAELDPEETDDSDETDESDDDSADA